MSIKEIKEAIEQKKIYFGIRQTLKNKNNVSSVFITRDTRETTVKALEDANVEFVVLKTKNEMSKLLNLDFSCEVFSIQK